MRPSRLPLAAILLFSLAALPGLTALYAQTPDVPPRPQASNDESAYRRFVLDNGIKVILLSDPKLNKSSASLAVAAGSLSDPPERQGLAHFLEHMLFLGTEKYPSEGDYGNYVRSNGGYSNAYTAGDHTNYHFEIRHEAFEGGLDRFSQFFIAPLFTPEFAEREINAVNSENQKNLEADNWREYQLRNSLYPANHPAHHFATGNRDTLGGTTRDELLAFYAKHYSANRMTLALTGKAGLDQLEAWARAYFAPIVNRDLAPNRFPPDYLPPQAALRLARVEPIRDLRQLTLEFPLPATRDYWQSKPTELIGFILGYEGEGSLLSQLKAEGLATGLGAGGNDESPDYGSFSVSVALTPAGLEKYPRVLELFFGAVAEMRRAGYPAYLFRERQVMAQLDELYQDQGEGTARAVTLANQVRDYPLEVAERVPFLWLEEDPAAYTLVLERLRPDNMLAVLTAKGLPTDRAEKYYGTKYSYIEDTGAAYAALLEPPTVAGLHLPKANPFIPQETELLPTQPLRIIDEPALSLYYAQDVEFERPMVAHIYRVRLPRTFGTLEAAVRLGFYEACANEALNEVAYTASAAGLHLGISAGLEGVQISINGYDSSAARLLETVVAGLIDIPLSEERFAAIKDRLVRGMRNFDRTDAWQYLLETRRSLVREFHFRPDEQLPVAETITLADVRKFARTLFQRGKIEALTYGNVTQDEAIAAARRVAGTLRTRAVSDPQLLRRRLLTMKPGETLATVEKLAVNNSAFRREYVLGGDEPELRAATMVIASAIEEPVYSELRTRQQLGYIVFGGAGNEERTNFAYFIVQSGDYPADQVQARADEVIGKLPELVGSLPDDAWEMIVAGAAATLLEKDKTIAERAGRLFVLAYDYDGEWGRREATLAALGELTRERTKEILAGALTPENRQMRSFLGFAREHKAESEIAPTITDRAAFKKTRTYR